MTTTRPMTSDEAKALQMLAGIKFPRDTFDCRIATGLLKTLAAGAPAISERQVRSFWLLLIRYQSQIRHPERLRYVRLAAKLSVPEKRRAMFRRRSQARRDAFKAAV